MLLECVREMRAAVPLSDEIQRVGCCWVERGVQRPETRHRDGRWWHARARIGVVGPVGHEILLAKVAVECFSQAVNYRWISLELHSEPQAILEHGRNRRPLDRPPRLLLDDRRENQRLVRAAERHARVSLAPLRRQLLRHELVRATQDVNVTHTNAEVERIREKQAFWGALGNAEFLEYLAVAQRGGVVLQGGMVVEAFTDLAEIPAFYERNRKRSVIAARQFPHELEGRDAALDFVVACLDILGVAKEPGEHLERHGRGKHPRLNHLLS